MLRGLAIALAALTLGADLPVRALPAAATQQLEKGQAALASRDPRGAEFHLLAALKTGVGRRDVAVAMGRALIAQGRYDDARGWLDPGQFAPGQELAGWRSLAHLERAQGNLAAAGQALDKALAIAPRDSGLWVEIGQLRYVGGEQWQAFAASAHALTLDPDNPAALGFRALLERDRSGPAAALSCYEQALALAPGDAGLRYHHAATLGELDRGSDMLDVLRQGSPGDPGALFLQSLLAARAGDYPLARALSVKAGQGWPATPAAQLLRAMLELEAGNANVAVGLLDNLIARQPVNYRVRLLLARALYESGQHAALLRRFSSVAARSDAPVYLLTLMGRAEEELGNRTAAAQWLDRAAMPSAAPAAPLPFPGEIADWRARWTAAPGSTAVAVPLVRALLAQRDPAGAERVAEAARAAHFGSADAQWLAGDAQLALGRSDAALDRYVAASQIRYSDLLVLRMAQVLNQQGRSAEAGAAAARYLAAFPGNRLAARLAANQRALAGDWETGRALLESLRQRGGGRDALLLADLSLAQLRTRDKAKALETARRSWFLQPGSPVTAQALGMALAESGQDPVTARALLDQAQALGGDNPLLIKARKQLAAR